MLTLNDSIKKGIDKFADDGLAIVRRLNIITAKLNERQGEQGVNGHDCVGADTLKLVPSDSTGKVKFIYQVRGVAKQTDFSFGLPRYQGPYETDRTYAAGHTVKYRGSTWIATRVTSKAPHANNSDWSLMVKAGRDGSGGKNGERGPRGDEGPNGFDKTTLAFREAESMHNFDKALKREAKRKKP